MNRSSGFSRALAAMAPTLHVAAHSHHPWPDVSFEAQQAAWQDAARLLDRKWGRIFAATIPSAQAHVARVLNLPDPATVTFGPNTHSFVLRILSCLPHDRPLRILTTGSEFMSFARQIARLEEEKLAQVTRIGTEPLHDFSDRFAEAARAGSFDLVYVSQVFFDSGIALHDLPGLIRAVRDSRTFIVIDGYHGFMALPTDLSAIAHRVFYLAGGYKYAMAGEGVCFLHAPPGYGARPRDTGWYAGFSALEGGGGGGVHFVTDGSRFLGSTFDVSGLYRFNAVQDWLVRENMTVPAMLAHVRSVETSFLSAPDSARAPIAKSMLVVPDDARRGRFLTFRTPKAGRIVEALAAKDVIADHRSDRLRIGFGIYHDAEDAKRLAEILNSLGP